MYTVKEITKTAHNFEYIVAEVIDGELNYWGAYDCKHRAEMDTANEKNEIVILERDKVEKAK